MSDCLDSSVVVAALVDAEPHHEACVRLMNSSRLGIYTHGLVEVFSTLTGGRPGFRLNASAVAAELADFIVPLLELVSLTPTEILAAIRQSDWRGVRGGAIYDLLHLAAARKARARRFYTLNVRHFLSFHRPGDPEVVLP